MAEHTVTELVLRKENPGQRKVWDISYNITTAGADGYTIAAGSKSLSGWKKIEMALVTGVQENMGYVAQLIPSALPVAGGALGTFKLQISGAPQGTTGPLDEVVSGDLGVFVLRIEGY
jgi:hypothetical protein